MKFIKTRWCSRILAFFLSLFVLAELVTPVSAAIDSKQSPKASISKLDDSTLNALSTGTTYRLNYKKYNLVKGKNVLLKVINLPSGYKVTYKSQNSSIAKVNSRGNVTGIKKGTTTITATIKYRTRVLRKLICKVTVGCPAVSVVIPESRISLNVKEKKDLNPIIKPKYSTEAPKYTSSNSKVVTVSAKGIIKGIKAGKATITVTIANRKSDACIVTVTKKATTTKKKKSK